MSIIFIVIALWQNYINAEYFFIHMALLLFMKGFDQTHVFLLFGLVVVVALLCPHQEDAA